MLRGLGIPIFLWLYLAKNESNWAFFVIAIGALTDYLDGKLARALNQTSKLGEILDPSIDRLYLGAILLAYLDKNLLPFWIVASLIGRDLVLGAGLALRKRTLPVTYLGKAATFNLLYALPLLLLQRYYWAHIFAWSFAVWGIGLYLLTGFTYLLKLIRPL